MARAGRIDVVRHLEYFVAIAEESHIGRAADRLEMSQPPLSQGLRRLELRLGTALFDRHARGVALTDAGVELLPRARALLEAARGILEPEQLTIPALRLGVAAQLPTRFGAALASGLRPDDASPTVTLTSASSVALADRVASNRLDLALITHPAVLAEVEGGEVVRLPTRVLLSDRHPRAGDGAVTLASLQGMALAIAPRSDNPSVYDLTADIAGAAGLHISRHPAPDDRAALGAAAGGGAVALTADDTLQGPGVVSAPLLLDPLPLRFRLIWRRDQSHASPPTRTRVMDLLRAEASR